MDEGIKNMQIEIAKIYENRVSKKLPNEVAEKLKIKYLSYIGLEMIIDTVRSIELSKLDKYLNEI